MSVMKNDFLNALKHSYWKNLHNFSYFGQKDKNKLYNTKHQNAYKYIEEKIHNKGKNKTSQKETLNMERKKTMTVLTTMKDYGDYGNNTLKEKNKYDQTMTRL